MFLKTGKTFLVCAALTLAVLGCPTENEDTTVSVTGVTLDQTALTFTEGDAAQSLAATVVPANATNKAVNWAVEPASGIVTIAADGSALSVTPAAAGTATITVTTADGKKTAACAVTVNAAPVAVTGVTLDKTSLTFTTGDSAQTILAMVAPANATNKTVTWTVAPATGIVTITPTGGTLSVTPIAVGDATITVATIDGNKTAACTVTVKAPVPLTRTFKVKTLTAAPAAAETTADAASLFTVNNGAFSGSIRVANAEIDAANGGASGRPAPLHSTIVYTTEPVTGPFTFTLKGILDDAAADLAENDKNLLIGAVANPEKDILAAETDAFDFVVLRLTGGGAFRRWITNSDSTAYANLNPSWPAPSPIMGTAYTYEIKWDGTNYAFKFTTGTGESQSTSVAASEGAPSLQGNAALYPAFILTKIALTVTEATLTQ
jgi:hypothetical protein